MKEIWIFNPDNDLALADGGNNYIAPLKVRQMVDDLSILPMWYANAESYVLAHSAYNQSFLSQMKEKFQLPIQLITSTELSEMDNYSFFPWGWSLSLWNQLLHWKVDEANLPTKNDIEQLRILSRRQQAVAILPRLILNRHYCGESYFLSSIKDCNVFVEAHTPCLLKSPLSGSGKGLNWCKGAFTDNIAGWCQRNIHSQGGVIGEPVYDKLIDFAMEFYSGGDGKIDFVGYSLFNTSQSGLYEGNVLASDECIETVLYEYISMDDLHALCSQLIEVLSLNYGKQYIGYLGVDMMICKFDDFPYYRIHPCVEINMRMNMGIVSHTIYKRYVSSDSKGIFSIDYCTDNAALQARYHQLSQDKPLQITNERVTSGYLPLTPISPHTQYHAFILIE